MLYFKRTDPQKREEAEILKGWENDPVLAETLRPNFDNKPFGAVSLEEVLESMKRPARVCFLFGESPDGRIRPEKWLGYVDVQFSHPAMMGPKEHAGWIAVCVGEKEAQGRGYGKTAMQFIEDFSRSCGLKRIELGVFDFNERAISLYEKCGYTEIGRMNDFAWHNGERFTGIHMEKIL